MLMKRIIASAFAAVLLTQPASPAVHVSANAAVLMDAESGRVLYSKNEEQMLPIASTTKIMTALVVLENHELDEKVEIPYQAVGIEGSSLYLKEGELLTVEELLYGMLLRSGNDAAVALAIYCAGSVEKFAELMNQKARELELSHCNFANSNGLDQEGHLCSALDLARIAAAAMDEPDFARIVASKSYSFGSRTVVNHNKLLWLYDGALGVKTGFTKKAGRTLVGAAERDGQLLITVTLNAPDDWNDHMTMLDHGFSQYPKRALVDEDQEIGEIPVVGGMTDKVPVQTVDCVTYPMRDGESCEIRLMLPAFSFAPINQGELLGQAQVYVGGQLIGTSDLIASVAVPESTKKCH